MIYDLRLMNSIGRDTALKLESRIKEEIPTAFYRVEYGVQPNDSLDGKEEYHNLAINVSGKEQLEKLLRVILESEID